MWNLQKIDVFQGVLKMKKKSCLCLCVLLVSCGGDGKNNAVSDHGCDVGGAIVEITDNSGVIQLKDKPFVYLTVSGNLNNITIENSYTVCRLTIAGSGNLVKMQSDFVTNRDPEVSISGNDNNVEVLKMNGVDLVDTGMGNRVYKP